MTEPVQAQLSFEFVYNHYTPLVRRLLRGHGVKTSDLDDVTQETFVIVHRLLPGFEGRSSLATWLYAVTWRVAANHRRRRRRLVMSGRLELAAEPSDLEAALGRCETAFEHAEAEQRDLLALREIGGLSISWIAELTGYARATVRSKLRRGRATLLRARAGATQRAEAQDRALSERYAPAFPVATAPDARVLPCELTAVTSVDDLVIALWRGPCTIAALDEVIGTLLTHARNRPRGIRYLSVVEPTSAPPNREGRDRMFWAARQLQSKLNAVAHVAEGSGRIAMIASIMNASIFLARSGLDPHYFSETGASLAWLAQFGPIDTAELTILIADMKRQLRPAPT